MIGGTDLILEQVLTNILSAIVKQGESPCSAQTHLNYAVYALDFLLPNYEPANDEMRQVMRTAIQEMEYYDQHTTTTAEHSNVDASTGGMLESVSNGE